MAIDKFKTDDRFLSELPTLVEKKLNEIIDKVNELEKHKSQVIWHYEPFTGMRCTNDSCKCNKEKTTGLTFEEAMVFLRRGKKISRPGWERNSKSCLYINDEDFLRTDWEVRE